LYSYDIKSTFVELCSISLDWPAALTQSAAAAIDNYQKGVRIHQTVKNQKTTIKDDQTTATNAIVGRGSELRGPPTLSAKKVVPPYPFKKYLTK
jgi:hypothetical protein